jgi:hypothetical protein
LEEENTGIKWEIQGEIFLKRVREMERYSFSNNEREFIKLKILG